MTEQVASYRRILKSTSIIGGASVINLVIDWVRGKNRDLRQLNEAGIPTAIHYPIQLHLQPVFAKEGDFPISEVAAKRVMSLPMGPDLTEKQQDLIVCSLLNCLSKCPT